MLTSPLQLERSILGELALAPREGPDWSDGVSVEAEPEYARSEADPALWMVRLPIRFAGGDGKPAPYEGHLEVTGYFRLLPNEFADDKQLLLVGVNAPAMLYSAAREILAGLTARGAHGTFLLPSMTFADVRLEADGAAVHRKRGRRETTASP